MADWEHLEDYLRRANYHYEQEIADPAYIRTVDESVTKSLTHLREIGIDTGDPDVVYAFITAIAICYTHGALTVQTKCGSVGCTMAYVKHHNQSHADLALVTRTLARNLGIDLPRYEEDEDEDKGE